MTILNDCSRHVWVAMLKSKSEVSQKIKDFIIMVENQFEKKVKVVRSDNGSELLFPVYYASKVITIDLIKKVLRIKARKLI